MKYVWGISIALALIAATLSIVDIADGAPGGCSNAQYKDESAPFIITADEGTVIHDVYIKSGEGAFPGNENDKCSSAITENGVDLTGCYLIEGIGTQVVTVTNTGEEGCHEISHIEANNPPDPTTTPTATASTPSTMPTTSSSATPETPTPDPTATLTSTPTPTPSATVTGTASPTPTETSIATPLPTATTTITPIATSTASPTPSPSSTPGIPAELPPTGGRP